MRNVCEIGHDGGSEARHPYKKPRGTAGWSNAPRTLARRPYLVQRAETYKTTAVWYPPCRTTLCAFIYLFIQGPLTLYFGVYMLTSKYKHSICPTFSNVYFCYIFFLLCICF